MVMPNEALPNAFNRAFYHDFHLKSTISWQLVGPVKEKHNRFTSEAIFINITLHFINIKLRFQWFPEL
jgi:hypothetical protein